MPRELRTPILVWILTSLGLLTLALQVESAVFAAGLYIALNGISMFLSIVRQPPWPLRPLLVHAWCTAAQLPTMLVLLFDIEGNRNPRKQSKRKPGIEPGSKPGIEPGSRPGSKPGTVTKSSPADRISGDRSQRPAPRTTEPDAG